MLGLILAAQSAVLLVVHLGLLGASRNLGERASGPSRAPVIVAYALVLALVLAVVLGSGATGHLFLAAQLAVFGLLAFAAARQPGMARVHVAFTHAALFALFVRFLYWRGLYDADGPTMTTRFVFQDFAAQLLLPAVSEAHRALFGTVESAFLVSLRAGVAQAARGVATHVVLLSALLTHAIAVVTVRAATSRTAPATLRELLPIRDGVVGALLVLVVTTLLPGVSPVLRVVVLGLVLPSLVVEALVEFDRQSSRLRSGRLPLLLLATSIPFVPSSLHVIGALGGLFALLPMQPRRAHASRAPLGRWAMTGLAATAFFGALAAGSGYLISPARGLPSDAQLCAAVRFAPVDDGVQVTPGPGASAFRMDVDERPLGSRSPAEAAAVCAAEGKRLCSSEEVYLVCACDHGTDGYARANSPEPSDALVRRALCTDAVGADADASSRCATDHGVRSLLGGHSELTSTAVAQAGHLVAGPNRWLHENWMVHCRWRSVLTDEALASEPYPMLAFRCCGP